MLYETQGGFRRNAGMQLGLRRLISPPTGLRRSPNEPFGDGVHANDDGEDICEAAIPMHVDEEAMTAGISSSRKRKQIDSAAYDSDDSDPEFWNEMNTAGLARSKKQKQMGVIESEPELSGSVGKDDSSSFQHDDGTTSVESDDTARNGSDYEFEDSVVHDEETASVESDDTARNGSDYEFEESENEMDANDYFEARATVLRVRMNRHK